jgi:hypothetical protein
VESRSINFRHHTFVLLGLSSRVAFQETAQLKDVAKLTHWVSRLRFINATEAETKEAVSRMTSRKLQLGHPENATVAKVTFL